MTAMEHTTLGRSGCSVSRLCLGTMTFGVETDEAGAFEQLDVFTAASGTLVDAADVYGGGVSEEIVGPVLAARPAEVRDQVVLATKGRFPTGPGTNDVGLSRRHLQRALEASLRRLGVDTVDLYQVHAWDPVTPLEETLATLDSFVRAGTVRYVGLSNFTGWQVAKARRPPQPTAGRHRSRCSRSTTCWSASWSGRSCPPRWTLGSGCCPGRPWVADG